MIAIFSKASLPMERGVSRIYSQSRGRGHRKFFWGLRPQTPLDSILHFSPPNPKCAPRSSPINELSFQQNQRKSQRKNCTVKSTLRQGLLAKISLLFSFYHEH